MEDVNVIFKTDIGISFNWKRCNAKHLKTINIIINDIALHLTKEELLHFANTINKTVKKENACLHCNEPCKVILLETPIPQLTLVKKYNDMLTLKHLIDGTIFQLGLNNLLKTIL